MLKKSVIIPLEPADPWPLEPEREMEENFDGIGRYQTKN